MPDDRTRSIFAVMDRENAAPISSPELVYMVEAYHGVGHRAEPPGSRRVPAGTTVLGVIDVPGDETALFLISAPDASAAERVVRDEGMPVIRVVPVQWSAVMPGGDVGNPPMLAMKPRPTVRSRRRASSATQQEA